MNDPLSTIAEGREASGHNVPHADQPLLMARRLDQIVRRPPVSCSLATPIRDVLETLRLEDIGSMLVTSTASDYKKFGDLLMATKTIQKVAGIQQVMTIDSVEYNKVPDSEFELPTAIKALVNQ